MTFYTTVMDYIKLYMIYNTIGINYIKLEMIFYTMIMNECSAFA